MGVQPATRRPRRYIFILLGLISALAIALGSAAFLSVRQVSAHTNSGHHTLYVGTSVGTGASCKSPGYTNVQAAVDAANKE